MFVENFEFIEFIMLYGGLFVLFVLMIFVVYDVLIKNNVFFIGCVVIYGVFGFGVIGFLVKGIIEWFWLSIGV